MSEPNVHPQASEARSATLAIWRARLAFQFYSISSMVVLLAVVLFGIGKEVRSSLGPYFVHETLAEDEALALENSEGVYRGFMDFVYHNQGLIDGVHLWGGYLLVLFMPLSGWALWVLGKRLVTPGNQRLGFRYVGVAIIATSLVSGVMSVATGKIAGPPTESQTMGRDIGASPSLRLPDQERAHRQHLYRAAPSSILAVILISVGATMVSLKSVKESAGIVKKTKKA